MMGVVNESAYLLLGSPACIALVDNDLSPLGTLFLFDDSAIVDRLLHRKLRAGMSCLTQTGSKCKQFLLNSTPTTFEWLVFRLQIGYNPDTRMRQQSKAA
jgi:hypothetical protein